MFTYRCPSCGKQHNADKPFEQDTEVKCLRCGTAIAVAAEASTRNEESAVTAGTAPPESAITRAPSAKAAAPAKASRNGITARPAGNGKDAGKSSVKPASNPRLPTPGPDRPAKEEVDTPPKKPLAWPPKPAVPPKPGAKGPRPRWQLIAAIAAVVLVVGGVGGYLVFGGKKSPPKKAVAKAPAKPKAPPPKKEEPKTPEKKEEPKAPPPKEPPPVDVAISAPRLAAELAARPAVVNAQYKGKVLEVSGPFGKVESRQGLQSAAHMHALFAVEGAAVACDLQGSPTDLKTWSGLPVNQPISVRGTYEKDGYLRDCFLTQPYTPSADARYRGKPVEVAGHVEEVRMPSDKQPFPAVRLEGDTNGLLELRCFFRVTDAEEVQKLRVGAPVVLQGVCSGRSIEDKTTYVRLDNCRPVDTSAPPAGTPRLPAAGLLREYEEDLRPFVLPLAGAEERLDSPSTVREMVNALAAEGRRFDARCRYRVLLVSGKLLRSAKPPQPTPAAPAAGPRRSDEQMLTLVSGDTDLDFRVQCWFRRSAWQPMDRVSEYTIRGLYTGMADAKTFRLDDCEFPDSSLKQGPTITANFLPHVAGRSPTYDVAIFGTGLGKKNDTVVRREVHQQGAQGLTEVLVTHMGPMVGSSLFDEDEPEKWIASSKTKKIRLPTPGTPYFHRLSGAFVEVGEPQMGMDGKPTTVWAPALKIGARAGDEWNWRPPSGDHDYKVEKFGDHRGRPSVVIRETITRPSELSRPLEILHVYVKDLGEVERREWVQINSRGTKRPLLEKRLVMPPALPGNKTKDQPPAPKQGTPVKDATPPAKGPAAKP